MPRSDHPALADIARSIISWTVVFRAWNDFGQMDSVVTFQFVVVQCRGRRPPWQMIRLRYSTTLLDRLFTTQPCGCEMFKRKLVSVPV